MAEKKKNSQAVTPSGTGGKGKKSGSRSTAADKARKADAEQGMAVQLAPYGLIILAVVLSICLIAGDGAGVVGGAIRNVLTGLSGAAAFLLPLFVIVETVMWKKDRMYGAVRGKMVCYAVVFALASALVHLFAKGMEETAILADGFSIATHYKNGCTLGSGGAIGGMLGTLLVSGFGMVCTVILVISAILLLGMYIFGLTPRGLWITFRYKLKIASEKRRERKAEQAAYESDYIMKRNRMREEEYAAYLKAKKMEEREAKRQAKAEEAARKQEEREAKAGAQMKIPFDAANPDAAKPSVYKVKRRGQKDTFVNEYVDETTEAAAEETPAEPVPSPEDREAVDEKLFDEVMRRTRERLEKNRLAAEEAVNVQTVAVPVDDTPVVGVADAPIILPPPVSEVPVVEYSGEALEKLGKGSAPYQTPNSDFHDGAGDTVPDQGDEYAYLSEFIDSVSDSGAVPKGTSSAAYREEIPAVRADHIENSTETDTVKLAQSVGEAEDFDLSGLFVNPDDAELLDRLSAAYIKTPAEPTSEFLTIERSDVGEESGAAASPAAEVKKPPEYIFPPIDLLTEDMDKPSDNIREELQENAIKLVETLKSFNVKTKIEDISRGPTITRYELQPEPGTKVRSITNLVDDIALNLATTGVRIEAPIPGKAAVGIEVPNKKQFTVHLRSLIEMEAFQTAKSRLTVCLGENVAGEAVYFDIAKMPHLLIAGATGMGKSVCINSLITSILYKAKPDEVKLILIDPKKVELSIYNGIPHLIVPVVSEPKKAAGSLSWAVTEMERRFGLIEAVGVRDIKMFNEVTKNDPDYEFMPQIVIIIDELADLMMTAPDDVEESICRLAQKARAAGMHLIIGTQRPSVDVITGLIKANIPSRIAFTVSSQVDSRTIIDKAGAENLIGRGDMLFNPVGAQKPMRVQGAFVSETDVEEVVSYVKNMNAQNGSYSDEVLAQIEHEAARCGMGKKGAAAAAGDMEDSEEEDPMLRSAIEVAVNEGKISTSLIQRRLSLGYGRAAKLIDRMEQMGYVSAPDGNKPREVLITKQEFMELVLKEEA